MCIQMYQENLGLQQSLHQTDHDSRTIALMFDAFALIAHAIIEALNNSGILHGFSACTVLRSSLMHVRPY